MFNQMVSCLNFANLQSSLSQINNNLDQAGQSLNNIGQAFSKFEQVVNAFTEGDASLTIQCGGSFGENCCGMSRTDPYTAGTGSLFSSGTVLNYRPSTVSFSILQTYGCSRGQYWIEFEGRPIPSTATGKAEDFFGSEGQKKFQLYCGPPGDTSKSRTVGGNISVNYCRGNEQTGCSNLDFATCLPKPAPRPPP